MYIYCPPQRAIECDASDATSMHLLGQWCYSVVSIPWYQRKIASVLFATPPHSTYEEVYTEGNLWLGLHLMTCSVRPPLNTRRLCLTLKLLRKVCLLYSTDTFTI